MLNEERIKLMVKLSSYESKEGKEDFKVSSYYKKDYVSLNRWYTVIWTTIGYALIVALAGIANMEQIVEKLTLSSVIVMAASVVAGYVVMLIVYVAALGRVFKKKHGEARQRVKKYSHNLLVLSKVYEKENM